MELIDVVGAVGHTHCPDTSPVPMSMTFCKWVSMSHGEKKWVALVPVVLDQLGLGIIRHFA